MFSDPRGGIQWNDSTVDEGCQVSLSHLVLQHASCHSFLHCSSRPMSCHHTHCGDQVSIHCLPFSACLVTHCGDQVSIHCLPFSACILSPIVETKWVPILYPTQPVPWYPLWRPGEYTFSTLLSLYLVSHCGDQVSTHSLPFSACILSVIMETRWVHILYPTQPVSCQSLWRPGEYTFSTLLSLYLVIHCGDQVSTHSLPYSACAWSSIVETRWVPILYPTQPVPGHQLWRPSEYPFSTLLSLYLLSYCGDQVCTHALPYSVCVLLSIVETKWVHIHYPLSLYLVSHCGDQVSTHSLPYSACIF